MIEKKVVWVTECDSCGRILDSYDSKEEAEESYEEGNFTYNVYKCVFCDKVVCSDCQLDIQIEAKNIPICKSCAKKHTIEELIEVVKAKKKGDT